MRTALLAMGLCAITSQAFAIERYQTMRMSCDEVQAVIADEGAAILRWRSKRDPSLPLYDRYVSDSRFCQSNEVAVFASVPTADDPSCNVRKCEEVDHSDRDYFHWR